MDLIDLVGMAMSLVDLVADLAGWMVDLVGMVTGLGWAGPLSQRVSSDSREVCRLERPRWWAQSP